MSMIVFSAVTKQFGEQDFAVKDISFEIDPGELVLVTGPSGSGKTTLMRLLTKEYLPTSGQIEFEETPLDQIRNSQIHAHRRKIGVVFQDYKLMPELNVWENIALALDIIGKPQPAIEEQVTDLLNLIELSDKAFLFPGQLSGGEAQRVSLARALALTPKVIFADEPTGNLDQETSISIAKLIEKINQLGTTVLFATHDPHIIEFFNQHRLLQLDRGRLTQDSGNKKPQSSKDSKDDQIDNSSTADQNQATETKIETETKPKPKSKKTKPTKTKSKLKAESTESPAAETDDKKINSKTRLSLSKLFSLGKKS